MRTQCSSKGAAPFQEWYAENGKGGPGRADRSRRLRRTSQACSSLTASDLKPRLPVEAVRRERRLPCQRTRPVAQVAEDEDRPQSRKPRTWFALTPTPRNVQLRTTAVAGKANSASVA